MSALRLLRVFRGTLQFGSGYIRFGFQNSYMNRKILEYFTAVDGDIKGLDQQVDSLIQRGYEPYGSPYVIAGEKVQVCQAIVRFENLDTMTLSADAPL